MPEVQRGGRGGTQKGTGTEKTWQDPKSSRTKEERGDRSRISWEKDLKPFYLDLERQGAGCSGFPTFFEEIQLYISNNDKGTDSPWGSGILTPQSTGRLCPPTSQRKPGIALPTHARAPGC